MKFLAPWLARASAALLLIGLLVRVSGLRDRLPVTDVIFYATPWPVLGGLAFALACYALGRQRRARALVLALVLAGSTAMWTRHSYVRAQPQRGDIALRLVFWNAGRPEKRRAQCVSYLQSLKADIIAVGESNVYTDDLPVEWRDGFAGRSIVQRRGFLLITPEPPVSLEVGRLADRGDYLLARCMVKDRAVTLLLVDFETRVGSSRNAPFARLNEIIAAHRDEPLVIAGDFNTPYESTHFDAWRTEFREAFDSAGHGFAETWPTFLPLLRIDQCWLGPRWRAVHAELGWSFASDHRAIIADLTPGG
ncbi:MAG: endonuclease/exonuclease/phosphatase family protein [Chthoniobacteraceae bacterium]